MQLFQQEWSKKYISLAIIIALLTVITCSGTAYGAASSSTTATTTRTSVHDPSIFYDSSTNQYYVFGSHLAQAQSSDLRKTADYIWTSLAAQAQMVRIFSSGHITDRMHRNSK